MDDTIFKRNPTKLDRPKKKKIFIRKAKHIEETNLVRKDNIIQGVPGPVTWKNYRQFFGWFLHEILGTSTTRDIEKVFKDANLLHKFGLGTTGTIGAVTATTALAATAGIVTIGFLSFNVPLFVVQMLYFILRFINKSFAVGRDVYYVPETEPTKKYKAKITEKNPDKANL